MRLFAKLFVIMLAFGAVGLGLLSLRQQRYEISNEISRAHNRIVEQERAQWRMRAEIARRSDPTDIRGYAERLKLDLTPIQESEEETASAKVSVAQPADGLGAQAESQSAASAPVKRKSQPKAAKRGH